MGEFRLTPQEDMTFGVAHSDDRLVFGPAGGQVVQLVAVVAVASLLGIVWAGTHEGISRVVGGVAAIGAVVWFAARVLRARVVATSEGLTIRNLVRARFLPWTAIDRISVVDIVREDWYHRQRSTDAVAVLVLLDGERVELPGFVSAAQSDGRSLGAITATRIKVDALTRYRDARSTECGPGDPAL